MLRGALLMDISWQVFAAMCVALCLCIIGMYYDLSRSWKKTFKVGIIYGLAITAVVAGSMLDTIFQEERERMSAWTGVRGTITINDDLEYSPAEGIKDTFEDVMMSTKVVRVRSTIADGKVVHNISFAFQEEGLEAARIIDKWVGRIPASASVKISTTIHWWE